MRANIFNDVAGAMMNNFCQTFMAFSRAASKSRSLVGTQTQLFFFLLQRKKKDEWLIVCKKVLFYRRECDNCSCYLKVYAKGSVQKCTMLQCIEWSKETWNDNHNNNDRPWPQLLEWACLKPIFHTYLLWYCCMLPATGWLFF